jgi:hypothetical protein
MKTSEVLRRVRVHLVDDGSGMAHHRYICYALSELYMRGYIGDRDRTRVKRLILSYLDGAQTLEEWLVANHAIACEDTPEYKIKIMATRKAWLGHLIEHYEGKGD